MSMRRYPVPEALPATAGTVPMLTVGSVGPTLTGRTISAAACEVSDITYNLAVPGCIAWG